MPIPPPSPVAPYDTWESVLQLARTRYNDAIQSLSGDILQDTAVFTLTMVTGAWRKFQTYLAQLGHSRFKKRVVLTGFPPFAANADPSQQPFLSWTEYYDGAEFWVPPNVSVLPGDFTLPLKIWERQSATAGQQAWPFPAEPMMQSLDGLPNRPYPLAWNGCWEWRDDAIFFPGSLWTMDYQIEYVRFLPDPATVGAVAWYSTATPYQSNQLVPVMRALSPLALLLCWELGVGRGDTDPEPFVQKAEDETNQLFNLEAKQKQRATCSRKRFSSAIRPGGYGAVGYGYGVGG